MSRRFLTPIESTVSTGTAPIVVVSTTAVTNLNADLLDGQHGSHYLNASNLSSGTVAAARMPALTGDITTTAGSISTTLANTAVSPSSYGSANTVPTFTVDSKGRLTAASNTSIAIAQSAVTNLTTDLGLKSNLASPTFTGTPAAPTATAGTNTTQIATTAFVATANNLKANLASPTFTGTVTVPTPINSTDAATKAYVDSVVEGLHVHVSCSTATVSNISNLASPPASIDGVTLTTNMRVLVKNQSTTSQNGIYIFNGTSLVRASDYDTAAEIDGGDFVFITGGTINDNTGWVQIETVVTLGTDPITFVQFSGAGTYTAGTGLSLTGNQFANTGVLSVTGTSNEIVASASTGSITLSIPAAIARLSSPTFTGTPSAPTAAVDTNTTQIATTAFVLAQASGSNPLALGSVAQGTSTRYARQDHVHPTAGLGLTSATLAQFAATTSSQLAGVISDETGSGALVFATSPTLTTPNIGIATGTSFNSITGLSSTTPIVDGTAAVGTGTTVARADHVHPTDTSRAPLASPTFTGTPTAPTATAGTNTTQIATTAYVTTAVASSGGRGLDPFFLGGM